MHLNCERKSTLSFQFLIFIGIFVLTSLNAIFNSLAAAYGWDFPYTTFIFSSDLFADYFKVILSYAHSQELLIDRNNGLYKYIGDYLHNNPYKGVSSLASHELTHFHLPPLTTAFSLCNLKLMHFVSPQIIFILILSFLFIWVSVIIKIISHSKTDALWWGCSFAICYPILFLLQRGNVFSAFTSLSIITFLILLYKNKSKYLALTLLALAVNVRPNAIIFVLAMLILKPGKRIQDLIIFTSFVLLIFNISLYIANSVYPDYTLFNFIQGVRIYHDLYVVGDGGLGYGSSLYGLLKFTFGYSRYFEWISTVFAGLIIFISAAFYVKKIISICAFVFMLCSAYTLGASVFADYHLLVFFAPLVCLYLEYEKQYQSIQLGSLKIDLLLIILACILLLSPKNYFFNGGVSYQVILNPMILIFVTLFLMYCYAGSNLKGNEVAH